MCTEYYFVLSQSESDGFFFSLVVDLIWRKASASLTWVHPLAAGTMTLLSLPWSGLFVIIISSLVEQNVPSN